MNLRDLGYLVALADLRHFGKAAEACFVSQPTLSTQLRKLEEELGVPLVERAPRKVMLTPVGIDMVQRARRGLLVASGLALGFLVSKSMDFVDKFHQGLSMSTDDFWLFYFSLTFFHFLHVVLGLVVLMLVWHKLRPLRTFTDDSLNWIESGTAYWHMVDLVWIVLFALVYVAR